MKLHFPKLYRYERKAEPCTVCIPFPEGAFRDGMRLQILDGDTELPVQSLVTSRHRDGSVRYLFARMQVDLPAGRSKDLEAGLSTGPAPTFEGVHVLTENGRVTVDGGEGGLRIELADNSGNLIDSLWDGRTLYGPRQLRGPVLQTGEGQICRLRCGEWDILEAGPLTAVLRCDGDLLPEGPDRCDGDLLPEGPDRCDGDPLPEDPDVPEETSRFDARITVHAGKPWLEIAFRLINTTSGPLHAASLVYSVCADATGALDVSCAADTAGASYISGAGSPSAPAPVAERAGDGLVLETTGTKELPRLEEQLRDSDVRCCVAISNYKTSFRVSDGAPVQRVIDTAYLMNEANEHFTEVFYGTLFADRTDSSGGVCATVFQAHQNYPKAVRSDRNGISVMLVPENTEKVVLQSGMSREQRFLLHFHGLETPLAELDDRSLIYQMPDRPRLDPSVFEAAGVAPDIFVKPEHMIPDVEISLISRCDAHTRSFGMLNFGDAPDPGYTNQGRGGGMLVWTNNEYDFPHACALLYMRTGERRFLDYLIASGSHWMDVDVCHYSKDPLLRGGQWEHCRCHVLDSTMVCSHQWVEGLLDLYHFTGDRRALETAIGIGDNVRRLLDTPAYQVSGESNARETGWALRTLTALYIETGDDRWLDKANWIVRHFREWTDTYGSWVSPYTDNTLIHVTFMIAVAMGSLARYYRIFPDEEIKRMLLDAADDLIESCLLPNGLFLYKELPSLDRLENNTLVLEAMTIAYELSGDVRYLKAGMATFRQAMAGAHLAIGNKVTLEGTVILRGEPTKSFAQSFIPLSVFYKAAGEAGLL